jgi:hypothetical protein
MFDMPPDISDPMAQPAASEYTAVTLRMTTSRVE